MTLRHRFLLKLEATYYGKELRCGTDRKSGDEAYLFGWCGCLVGMRNKCRESLLDCQHFCDCPSACWNKMDTNTNVLTDVPPFLKSFSHENVMTRSHRSKLNSRSCRGETSVTQRAQTLEQALQGQHGSGRFPRGLSSGHWPLQRFVNIKQWLLCVNIRLSLIERYDRWVKRTHLDI